jgi:hypothetical protein
MPELTLVPQSRTKNLATGLYTPAAQRFLKIEGEVEKMGERDSRLGSK